MSSARSLNAACDRQHQGTYRNKVIKRHHFCDAAGKGWQYLSELVSKTQLFLLSSCHLIYVEIMR